MSTAAGPIDPVIARMEAIEASLPGDDGVARFNHLYLAVTRAVASDAGSAGFENPEFLARLDAAFADRYFAAVDAAGVGHPVTEAWAPLFAARSNPLIAAIQFALAGMNAHINYDLCQALVDTARTLALELRDGSPEHRDYLRVNGILDRVERTVKADYDVGLVGIADEALGRLDDVVAMWSVARARDAAWAHAQVLAELEDAPAAVSGAYLAALAGMTGLAGRGLLLPVLPSAGAA